MAGFVAAFARRSEKLRLSIKLKVTTVMKVTLRDGDLKKRINSSVTTVVG